MPDARAIGAAPPDTASFADRLEQAGVVSVFAMGAALQISIAAAETLLVIAGLCWLALLVVNRERFDAPRFFRPLVVLAALTLLSAAFSPLPVASLVDSRQLLLFLIVPIVYRLAAGKRGTQMITVLVSVGAASAAFGIFQYGILRYDNLGERPMGTLGHYMTYSGLLMLVIGTALAKVLFAPRDRIWAALVLPALAVAVAVTFTRSALVGACVAAGVLFLLKDFRLLALLPVIAAAFFATAPERLTERFMSTFDMSNATIRDRVAMARAGQAMIQAHPLVGVGPEMVQRVYPEYRDPDAIEPVVSHLHNVPVQIAAERGLPALGVWCWFVVVAVMDLFRSFRSGRERVLAAVGLASMAAMLAAGLFEYNFGDSEFQMLLLLLITLPFAASRQPAADSPRMMLPPLDAGRARDLVHRLAGLHVLVVGDVMLDRFIVGTVSRISPEAPVPVVRFRSEYDRLGGAANVANNLLGLGGRVSLVGVTGVDAAGERLRERLGDSGVSVSGLVDDPSRPTIEKVRVVTERNQQVARIDYEHDADVSSEIETRIVARVRDIGRDAHALLVSDYLKGTITPRVMQALLELKRTGRPLLVDPKIPHLDRYAGASVVTPNAHEAEIATHRRIASDEDAQAAATEFRTRARCEAALITRGEQGMWLSSQDDEGGIPAIAREVSDVTGAGDTVVATLALAMAAGATLREAAILANHAAAVVVGKFGPATVTRQELLSQFTIQN